MKIVYPYMMANFAPPRLFSRLEDYVLHTTHGTCCYKQRYLTRKTRQKII